VGYWADDDRFCVVLLTNRADHAGEDELIRDIIGMFPAESLH